MIDTIEQKWISKADRILRFGPYTELRDDCVELINELPYMDDDTVFVYLQKIVDRLLGSGETSCTSSVLGEFGVGVLSGMRVRFSGEFDLSPSNGDVPPDLLATALKRHDRGDQLFEWLNLNQDYCNLDCLVSFHRHLVAELIQIMGPERAYRWGRKYISYALAISHRHRLQSLTKQLKEESHV